MARPCLDVGRGAPSPPRYCILPFSEAMGIMLRFGPPAVRAAATVTKWKPVETERAIPSTLLERSE